MKFNKPKKLIGISILGIATLNSVSANGAIIESTDYSNDVFNPTFIGTLGQGMNTVSGSVGLSLEDVIDAFIFQVADGLEVTRLVNKTYNVTPTKEPGCDFGSSGANCTQYGFHTYGHGAINSELFTLSNPYGTPHALGSGPFYRPEDWAANPELYTMERIKTDSDFWENISWYEDFDIDVTNYDVLENAVFNDYFPDNNGPGGWSSFDWKWEIYIEPIANVTTQNVSANRVAAVNAPATVGIFGLSFCALMGLRKRNQR